MISLRRGKRPFGPSFTNGTSHLIFKLNAQTHPRPVSRKRERSWTPTFPTAPRTVQGVLLWRWSVIVEWGDHSAAWVSWIFTSWLRNMKLKEPKCRASCGEGGLSTFSKSPSEGFFCEDTYLSIRLQDCNVLHHLWSLCVCLYLAILDFADADSALRWNIVLKLSCMHKVNGKSKDYLFALGEN